MAQCMGCDRAQLRQQIIGVGRATQQSAIFRRDESLVDQMLYQCEQRGVEMVDVEQADRFSVDADLRPGDDLEQLIERPKAARERDEGIGEIGHQHLPFVHAANLMHVRHLGVCVLTAKEAAWHHANDLAALREHRVGKHTHQAAAATAIHSADVMRHQRRPKGASRVTVRLPYASLRASVNTNLPHHSSLRSWKIRTFSGMFLRGAAQRRARPRSAYHMR